MWVDQQNTLASARNPDRNSSQSDALRLWWMGNGSSCAFRTDELLRQGHGWTHRYANAGWKGKGLFSTYSKRADAYRGEGPDSKVALSDRPIVGELVGLYFQTKGGFACATRPFLWL